MTRIKRTKNLDLGDEDEDEDTQLEQNPLQHAIVKMTHERFRNRRGRTMYKISRTI